jgi:hypothetical protein
MREHLRGVGNDEQTLVLRICGVLSQGPEQLQDLLRQSHNLSDAAQRQEQPEEKEKDPLLYLLTS